MEFKIYKIQSVFDFSWDDSFVFDGQAHGSWEVVFVESGEVVVTEDERVYNIGENNMIIHAPMEFHTIRSAKGSKPHVKVLAFFSEGVLPEQLKNGVFWLEEQEREEYAYVLSKASSFFKNKQPKPYDAQEVYHRLSAFLIHMGQKQSDVSLSGSTSAKLYRKIVTFMAQTVTENLSMDEVASRNYVSTSYLNFLFAKYAGISPNQYVIHLRIRYDNELLDKGHSVLDVASLMNCSSHNYFSAFYKKHTGISPSMRKK